MTMQVLFDTNYTIIEKVINWNNNTINVQHGCITE